MNLNSKHNVYLIGIGGIGMSALARYFASENNLTGSIPDFQNLPNLQFVTFYDNLLDNYGKFVFSRDNKIILL